MAIEKDLMEGQLPLLPDLELPTPSKTKPKSANVRQQIAVLQDRVFKLELEITLLRLGDKDHAV